MRALFKAAALIAVAAMSFAFVDAGAALAQASSQATVSSPEASIVAPPASSSVVASVPTDGSTIVTVPIGDWTNRVVDLFGALLTAAVTALIAIAIRFLPNWLQPLITVTVQTAIAGFVRQGFGYAIQEVENFDKDKTVDLNVGSAGVASALTYVIQHAPPFLINLAGGKDSIVEKIIAFLTEHGITLDSSVQPAQVAAATVKASP